MKQPRKVVSTSYIVTVNGATEDRFNTKKEVNQFVRDISSNPNVEFIEIVRENISHTRVKTMRPENKVVFVNADELGASLNNEETA